VDRRLCIIAVGPVTAAPLEAAGLVVSYPSRWRLGALVRELVTHFSDNTIGIRTPDGLLVMRATAAVLNGRILPLTPTGLEILRVLAGAAGNVVPREDLADLLPGGHASSHAVDAAINRLRENAESRTLVRTVVKRGYALAVSES
jgi:uroporphyrinogen-III synthase